MRAQASYVVAVRHHCNEPCRVLLQHVGQRLDFVHAAPGRDGGVLCGWDAEPGHRLVVVFARHQNACQGVRAFEVDQMRRATHAGRLHRAYAAEAEIVQLEVDALDTARTLEVLGEEEFHLTRLGSDSTAVPDLREDRLQVVCEREAGRVGILNGHQDVVPWDD